MTEHDDEHLLARVDERVRHIEKMIEDFVRRQEFRPIQLAVFGMIGLLLSAIIAAIVAQVIK